MTSTRTHWMGYALCTVVVLGTVACNPTSTEVPEPTPNPAPTYTMHTEIPECVEASKVPAYTVQFEDGSTVDVPSGEDQVAESDKVDVTAHILCIAIVDQWKTDREYPGYEAR